MQEVREIYDEEIDETIQVYGKPKPYDTEKLIELLNDKSVIHVEIFNANSNELKRRTLFEGKQKITIEDRLEKLESKLANMEKYKEYKEGIFIISKNGQSRILPCNVDEVIEKDYFNVPNITI